MLYTLREHIIAVDWHARATAVCTLCRGGRNPSNNITEEPRTG